MKLRHLRKRLLLLLPASLLALGSFASTADAAVDAFLNIDGIQGESQDSKHKGEIDVQGWSWGGSRVSATRSKPAKPNFENFNFQGNVSKASPKLFEYLATGRNIPSAELTLRKTGGNQIEFLKICFGNALVESVQDSGGSEQPAEAVSLSYQRFTYRYTAQDAKGNPMSPVFTGWDVFQSKIVDLCIPGQ